MQNKALHPMRSMERRIAAAYTERNNAGKTDRRLGNTYAMLLLAFALVFTFTMGIRWTAYADETETEETEEESAEEKTATTASPLASSEKSYTVLILDESGSMQGVPMKKQKEAATVFVEKVLAANSGNQIALVELNSTSQKICDFTNDAAALKKQISTADADGGTNMNEALEVAGKILNGVKGNSAKNIVLCSDGIPESGDWVENGKYGFADHPFYAAYGNACYKTAESIKAKGYVIYTVGMFYSLQGTDFTFGKQLMEDLASPEKNGAGKLSFVTDDMDALIDSIIPEIIENIVAPEADTEVKSDDSKPHIVLDKTKITLLYDENTGERETVQLNAQVFPSDYPNQDIEWYTDRDKVAEVENGLVVAVDEGETTIHASLKGEDDVNGSCKVKVSLVSDELAGDGTGDGIPGWYEITDFDEYDEGGVVVDNAVIKDISMSKKELNLSVGVTKKLPLVIDPKSVDESDVEFIYTSSDENIAEVKDGGFVEGTQPGEAVITVALKDDSNKRYVSASIVVNVAPPATAFTKVIGGEKKLGLTWKKKKSTDYVDGYQIEYSTNKNMSGGKKVIIASRKSSGKTINGLTNGKTYYARVRTYHNYGNKKIFSSWSKVKSAKIKNS